MDGYEYDIFHQDLDLFEPADYAYNAGYLHPKHYISCRFTIPHQRWPELADVLTPYTWYISYPHFGKTGTNQHFHVFLPGSTKKDADCIRNRIKKLDIHGNKHVSIKLNQNGLEQAIQYGSREKTTPSSFGFCSESWILRAPKWMDANLKENLYDQLAGKRKREDPEGIKLTAVNHVRLAFNYHKEKNLKFSTDLGHTILHMLSNGHYLCPQFARRGVPDFYQEVFETSVAKGHYTWAHINQSTFRAALWKPVNPML